MILPRAAETKTPRFGGKEAPLHRLELCSPAPEADALSTELQGRVGRFYHMCKGRQLPSLTQNHAFANGANRASSPRS